MKINDVEVMILKVSEAKTNPKGGTYYSVDFAILDDGSTFSVNEKDANKIKDFKPFQKAVINVEISNSKYGIVMKII